MLWSHTCARKDEAEQSVHLFFQFKRAHLKLCNQSFLISKSALDPFSEKGKTCWRCKIVWIQAPEFRISPSLWCSWPCVPTWNTNPQGGKDKAIALEVPKTCPGEFTKGIGLALSVCFHMNCCWQQSVEPELEKNKIWDISQQVSGQLWRNLITQQGEYKLPQIFFFQTLESHNFPAFWRNLWTNSLLRISPDGHNTALNINCGEVSPVFVCLFACFCPHFTAQDSMRGFYSRAGEVLQL